MLLLAKLNKFQKPSIFVRSYLIDRNRSFCKKNQDMILKILRVIKNSNMSIILHKFFLIFFFVQIGVSICRNTSQLGSTTISIKRCRMSILKQSPDLISFIVGPKNSVIFFGSENVHLFHQSLIDNVHFFRRSNNKNSNLASKHSQTLFLSNYIYKIYYNFKHRGVIIKEVSFLCTLLRF